jgi:tripartite-type tricarboxylate transporter receptor subunit TctC
VRREQAYNQRGEVMMATNGAAVRFVAAALMAAAGLAGAQSYPSKPMRMIVPFPPGGATDILGRYVAQRLGETFGQQFIVDNRPGANGTLGLGLAAKAAPDGHTLVVGQTGNLAISPGLTKVSYDPLRDFAPVTLLVSSPHVITVHPSLPVRSLKDLIALARSRPGQLNYASTGAGSAGHLSVELLKKVANIDLVHVPYKGATPGFTDLVAGHVAMIFTSVLSTQSFARAGRVRMIAVGSAKRSPSAPDIPTIAESGIPGLEVASWWGVLGPAGMPADIVARLNSELVKLKQSSDARDRIGALGADIVTSTPAQFADYIKSEGTKGGQVIRDSGARID